MPQVPIFPISARPVPAPLAAPPSPLQIMAMLAGADELNRTLQGRLLGQATPAPEGMRGRPASPA